MNSEFFDYITEGFLENYTKQIEEQLIAMSIGSTLCVHETLYIENNDPEFNASSYQALFISHVLDGEETCSSKAQKTQYGPKTQEIADQMNKWSQK